MKRKMRVFLAGGNGFIGKNILEKLKDKYIFLAPSSKKLNLVDANSVENFLKSNPVDIVIHAAKIGGTRNGQDSTEIAEANLRMFFNIARCKKYFKKIIFFGSGAEYDNSRSLIGIKENDFDKAVPMGNFYFGKYICSKFIEKSENIINLRLFGIYGKYEDYRLRFISNAICKALFGLPITIKQNVYFDYLYVDDFVKILDYFLRNNVGFKSYNVGTGKRVSLLEIAELIEKVSGKNLKINILKKGLKNEYTCDTARLRREIKDLKFINFEQSIKELYFWYKSIKNNIKKKNLFFDE